MRKIEEIRVNLVGDAKSEGDRVCRRGDDYSLIKVQCGPGTDIYQQMVETGYRFDGIAILLCTKGRMTLEVDLIPDVVEADMLTVIRPRTIVRYMPQSGEGQAEMYMLLLSMNFIHTINIDINSINTRYFTGDRPHLKLDRTECDLLVQSFDMLHSLTVANRDDENYSGLIARSHIASIFYQLMLFSDRHVVNKVSIESPRTRRVAYVHTFMGLVHKHHRHERSVSFYADNMCISPKYLSMVIKDTTGRSAGEWIDDFVITEAKNLLKFSDKNIQQIAYELNFASQSSFGKYFKHLTGMSPTQYQSS